MTTKSISSVTVAAICGSAILLAAADVSRGADQPQWGQAWNRNMVSDEPNLPAEFDLVSGKNVIRTIELGTESYASPIVAEGKVLVGTNNERPRLTRHRGDRGVLLCLDERDGKLLWQLTVPKVAGGDPYQDWTRCGIVSPPTVEAGRAYVVTNRADVVCLDMAGLANGNDGYQDEGRFMAPEGVESVPVKSDDADIIWTFSLPDQAGMYRHDGAFASILIDGRYLYLNSCNGVDNTHRKIRRPDAPSLVVLDKHTGRLVARDGERIGPKIFHSTWAPPSMGEVGGRKLVFFGGPDGVCYAFEPLAQDAAPAEGAEPATLKKVWQFDCDPNSPKQDVHRYTGNRSESPSTIAGMPVLHGGRIFVAAGGDIWWGKRQCWLKCIDATKSGDVTASAQVWSAELSRHSFSTPAISDGLVYIADCGRLLHCLDAATGATYWTHETKGEIWSSPLVADGKVYIGSRSGDFHILAHGREKKLLCSVQMDSAISAPPTAANGKLYLLTMNRLYVLGKK